MIIAKYISRGNSGAKLGVLLLRGGLGNQLHQILAMSRLSTESDFDVIIYDRDSRTIPRDNYQARYLNFPIEDWFDSSRCRPFVASGLLDLLIRIIYSIVRKYHPERILSEYDFQSGNLPKFFFIQDYFANSRYVDSMEPIKLLSVFPKSQEKIKRCAIHLRFTDFLKIDSDPLTRDYYGKALSAIPLSSNHVIDVFSDDIRMAKDFLSAFHIYKFEYPELERKLQPEELLITLSSYQNIIASRSSLCWWACVLASLSSELSMVVSPWDSRLSRSEWLTI